MGSMGMLFKGPVTIESADAGSRTVKIKAKTTQAGGQAPPTATSRSASAAAPARSTRSPSSGKAGSMGE